MTTQNLVTFKESKDPCIKGTEIEVDAGRKANIKREIAEARSRSKTRLWKLERCSKRGEE